MTAQRVYDWERNYVEPHDVGFLSREDTRTLVTAGASFLGIPMPTVRFVKASTAPCRANPADWSITICDWGRGRTTILHELAHLGSVRAVMAGEDAHGPTFVATAIHLYARFIGLDAAALTAAALRVGIEVGVPPRPPSERRFMDVDF